LIREGPTPQPKPAPPAPVLVASVREKEAGTPARHLDESIVVRGGIFYHDENITDLQHPMAVMRAARGTETVAMLAISFNGDRRDSQSCDP